MNQIIEKENQYWANNYAAMPVVLHQGKGIHVWDTDGKQYIDCLSAYSAVSHGHCHPKLVDALTEQAQRLSLTSRAFHTDTLAPFGQQLCELSGLDKALPMNTGAEAVETAIKAARKWGYQVKKIPQDKAQIIVCEQNFHGRTTTIVGFSSEAEYRADFGPFAPGFKHIPFGDADALEQAITPETAAFLVEPIQGEGGIILPPPGYLKRCAAICAKHNVLLMIDEIQTGLGRTGKLFAFQHEHIKPDILLLGKALGGGLLPVSVCLGKASIMNLFTPGTHGSTFGGNPLAARVGLVALETLIEEKMVENSAKMGAYLLQQLQTIDSPLIKDIRGKGLFIAIDIDPDQASAHDICLQLLAAGLLSKDTHETVIRLAPPLIITQDQLDQVVVILKGVLIDNLSSGDNQP